MHCYTHLPKNENMRKRTRWGLRRGKERGDATTWIWWKRVRRIAVGNLCFQCGNIVAERHTSHVECQSQVGSQQHSTANAFLFTEAYQQFCDCCKLQFQRATVTQNKAVEIQLSIYIINHSISKYYDCSWRQFVCTCVRLAKTTTRCILEVFWKFCHRSTIAQNRECRKLLHAILIADCKAKGRSNTWLVRSKSTKSV